MAAHCFVFLHLVFLCTSITYPQGWQFVGPDSTSWQNVSHVSAKWFSPTSCRLAASSAYKGIAVLATNSSWQYPIKNWYWEPWGTGTSYHYFEYSPWNDTAGFLGFAEQYTEPAFYIQRTFSASYGQWTRSGCWITPLSVVFPPNSDSTVFASVCGLHRSTNRGQTWDTIGGYNGAFSSKNFLTFDEHSNQIVYMSDGRTPGSRLSVYRSTDQARTWDSVFSAGADYIYYRTTPYTLIANGDTILIGVRPNLADSVKGIYRTTNQGTGWTRVYADGRVTGILKSHVTPNTLFAASEEGILKSTDFGATWTMHNNALPTRRLTSLIISPYSDTMFVSTETHGVLKVWNYLTDVAENVASPSEFRLYQNYPNPFNPTTTIRFSVGTYGHTSLRVFDLLGREVAALVNEEMKPGSYERTFSGDGLASGFYFYRLHTPTITLARKMLLIQ